MSRVIYEISQTGSGGVLLDVLTKIIANTSSDYLDTIVWTVFDLRWVQREDGLMNHGVLEMRSRDHNLGLRLRPHGMHIFLSEMDQVIDGLFIGDTQFRSWLADETPETLLRNSLLGFRAFDSTFWQVSSSIASVNTYIQSEFAPHIVPDPEA